MRRPRRDLTPTSARDAAIIALGYACGLRRAELVALDLSSYDQTAATLTTHGKRHKIRAMPLEAGAGEALADWLAVRGEVAGPLFVRIRRGGNIGHERLTDQAIYHIEATRAATAGVARFSPHDLRSRWRATRRRLSVLLQSSGHAIKVHRRSVERSPNRGKMNLAELGWSRRASCARCQFGRCPLHCNIPRAPTWSARDTGLCAICVAGSPLSVCQVVTHASTTVRVSFAPGTN